MDVREPENEILRPPLFRTDIKNGARIREVSSRYRSPAPTLASGSKRSPSPAPVPKRAVSAERKRSSRPSSPPTPSPSTPIKDTYVESRKLAGNKSLWPSTTMRSLTVSFQSDTISVPVSKKPVSHTPCDRTFRSSSNVAQKQVEKPVSRKSTPERKRSPLKGKNFIDQSENSKPIDSLHARLVDQHRWPSRTGKSSSTDLNRSINLNKSSSLYHSGINTSSLTSKPLQKSSSDLIMQISRDESRKVIDGYSIGDNSPCIKKVGFSSSSDRTLLANAAARALASRPISPSVSRGVSPSRVMFVNPSSKKPSPARIRQSSPSRQHENSNSVLSFIVDIKKGKKAANQIEDVHYLRMLYNRQLQWRYANARASAVLHSQKIQKEKIIYNAWRSILDLWDSVIKKRINLQQLNHKLMLYSVLNNQMTWLEEWSSIERHHANSLTWTIQDLQATTIRIPITGGARGDIETVKDAVRSAADVMQAMGSSLCSIGSKVEGMNSLVSELAGLAVHEKSMLDECESLLESTAALQVKEHSLRTYLLQLKQAYGERSSILGY